MTRIVDQKKRRRKLAVKICLVRTVKFCGRHKQHLLLAFKILIVVAVTYGVVRTIGNALKDFEEHQFDPRAVNFRWLGLASLLYFFGLVPAWLFWHLNLRVMGQQPTLWESGRAFYVSQIGKYVPGKAMVVVLRVGAVRSERCNTTVAATSVFVETLTYMAVGGLVSAGIIAVLFHDQMLLVALAIAAMLCAGVPTFPPIFRRVVRLLQVSRVEKNIDNLLQRLDFRLMAAGWLLMVISWLLMGLTLWATVQAMPDARATLDQLPLLIACTALSTVLGFVSMLPGGLGVRELTIITLMERANFAARVAFLSAVLFRLAGLVAEVAVLIMLNIVHRLLSKPKSRTAGGACPKDVILDDKPVS